MRYRGTVWPNVPHHPRALLLRASVWMRWLDGTTEDVSHIRQEFAQRPTIQPDRAGQQVQRGGSVEVLDAEHLVAHQGVICPGSQRSPARLLEIGRNQVQPV